MLFGDQRPVTKNKKKPFFPHVHLHQMRSNKRRQSVWVESLSPADTARRSPVFCCGGHIRREEGRNCGGSRGCSVAGCFVLLMVSFLVLASFQDPDSIQELTHDHTHNTTSVFDHYLRKTRSKAKELCGVEWFWALITFVYGGLLVLGYRRRRRVLRMFALALFGFVSAVMVMGFFATFCL
eukprot:g8893.t1